MINSSKKIRKNFNSTKPSNNKNRLIKASGLLILAILIFGNLPDLKLFAAGTISGRVFQDYNGNGTFDTVGSATLPAIDAGIGGVTVTAYDSSGVAQGTVITSAVAATLGQYSLPTTGTGPYRIEFTNLPANYQPSARSTNSVNGSSDAASSGSTVQFVADGGASNVNVAINASEDYCQNNPTLCTAIFRPGNQSGTRPTSISVPYEAPTVNTNLANESQTGTVYGTAYQKSTRTIFQSAYMKRHAGFGPLGTGGIYKIDMSSGAPVFSQYINVQSIGLNTGTDPRAGLYTLPNNGGTPHWDHAAYTEVGKRAIGDLDYDAGRNILWFINLSDRRLHGIQNVNPGVAPVNADLVRDSSNNLGFNVNTAAPIVCTNGVLRPFGLEIHRGLVYVGAVCTAESAGAVVANLRAYVLSMNPDNPAAGFTQVLSFPLNYTRTKTSYGGDTPWDTWHSADSSRTLAGGDNPQPIVSDLEFDKDGSIIMALKDRWGDQYAANQYRPDTAQTSTTLTTETYAFGDILRFCSSGGTFSNPGTAGCANNPRPAAEDGLNAGSSQGPGGGEFYGGDWGPDDPDNFAETAHGALAILPGSNRVVITSLDPIDFHSNGFKWLSNTDGNRISGYNTFTGSVLNTTNDFNKGNGLGDVELLCDRAPIELGNRVWNDDGDGVQEPGEAGIANVTVRLYNNLNVLIATAVTDANGEYYFTSGTAVDGDITNNIGIVNGQITPNTDYQIRLDLNTNYTGAGALNGRLMTTRDQTSQAGFDEGSDSDSSLVVNPTGSPVAGTYPVIAVTTGAAGSNNHNLDVGFASSATYSIGNRVWFDTNNDGQINAGEVGIDGVSVSLFLDANGDGTPDTPGTPVATQNTASGGYYRFDSLAANNYVVRINPTNFIGSEDADTTDALVGYRNTTNSNSTDLDSTSVAGQNGENGIDPGGAANSVRTGGILSATIALGAPGEPVSEADVLGATQGAIDAAANMTVDFGFYRLNLSGTVWRDTGAGASTNNGTLNTGETGIAAVVVRLYNSANNEIPVGPDGILGTLDDAIGGMNTDGSGNYNFQGLLPGTYRVVITSNGATSSTPTSTTPDDNINSNDDGTPQTSGVFNGRTASGLVTLTPGNAGVLNNNTILNTNGSTSNPTVDFGLVTSPTAIGLESFDAFADLNGGVTLKWSTGNETDNLGFNIYREVSGKRELLNNSPIAGSALRSNVNLQASGDSYIWTDAQPVPGAVYYLEDIDLDGGTNLYGAVSAKMQFSNSKPDLKSKLLSDLAEVSAPNQFDSTVNASGKPKAGNKIVQNTIASQTGVKITVRRDGWYRISAQQLQAAGFEVNSNQVDWQMFANGEEVPFKLNADNSVEFFGRGLDTPATDQQAYYLTVGSKQGQRIGELKGGTAGETADAKSFRNVAVRRDRGLYASAILNGEAENWFGAVVGSSGQTMQDLTIYNPDTNGGNARLSVKLQGLTNSEHLVGVRFNDLDLGAVNYSNRENRVFEFDVPMSSIQSGTNRVSLQATGAGSDVSVVDSISLSYARFYKVENDRLRFTVPAGQTVRVGGFSNTEFEVYEIRGGKVSAQILIETEEVDETAGFSLAAANSDREFLAVGKLQNEPAVLIENNTASDWRNPSNKADFVIITPNAFRESAAQLAELRRSQGLKTEVVAVEDLYDEFTFGAHSPVAVQEFLRTATSQWKVKPQYALLFGDSSYDSRNYLGGTNRDLVPTKLIDTEALETSSDALLADFNNDGIEDIALGRLPVVNQTEAARMISKIQRYERANFREERSNLFVSDRNFETYSNTLNELLPVGVDSSFVNRTGTTDNEMRQSLIERLNQNATVVTYWGHGSTTLLAGSNIFRNGDALNLNNQKLSFYMMMTCLNGYTHNPSADSLAESMMKSDNGAIAVWASSGVTNADGQLQLSQAATNLLFNAPQPLRIGAIVRNAKLGTSDQDVRRTWQLIGDPTIFIR